MNAHSILGSLRSWRILHFAAAILIAWPALAPLRAYAAGAGDSDTEAALSDARDRLLRAEYEEAIEILEPRLAEEQPPAALREIYLLLINAHVLRANAFKSRGDVRTGQLWEGRAEELIMRCLRTDGIRDTRPNPEEEYPPEMVRLFRDIRAEMLGGFRVTRLDPPEARVFLDGEPLGALEGLEGVGDENVPVGVHVIDIRAAGWKSRSEQIVISGGTILERTYELERPRGVWWWASRAGLVAAGVTGAVLLGSGEGDSQPEPLPGPPDPPK